MASPSGVAKVYGQTLLDSVGQGYPASLRTATAAGDDRRDPPAYACRDGKTVCARARLRDGCNDCKCRAMVLGPTSC